MNKLSFPKVTPSQLFFALYILISAATFRHSTIGFASLEGSMAWGALSALAVDVLMILFAHAIRQDGFSVRSGESWGLALGLSIPALASIYTQLLFAVTEAQILQVSPGAAWMGDAAVNITNVRVVGLPALLPVLALVAALMGKHDDAQTVSAEDYAALDTQLDNARLEATELRRTAQLNAAQIESQGRIIDELQTFESAVRNPAAWKDATAAAQLISGTIFPNDKRPSTKVLARLLGVGQATVSTAIRKIKNDERASGG